MKTLVVYYSYTGNTKKIAMKKAAEMNADTIELLDAKKRGKFSAYTGGCFASMKGKKAALKEFNSDFSAYGKVIVAAPIWAGHPAPAFNNVVPLFKSGQEIELIFSLGGGYKDKIGERAKAMIEKSGAKVVNIKHYKGAGE